jgi:hypothetical protein
MVYFARPEVLSLDVVPLTKVGDAYHEKQFLLPLQ